MQAEMESNLSETEAARKTRLAAAVDRNLQRIREMYEDFKRTPQKHAQKRKESEEPTIPRWKKTVSRDASHSRLSPLSRVIWLSFRT
jgi:hypothetical protein